MVVTVNFGNIIFSFQFGHEKNCNEVLMLISMLSTTILYGLSKTQNKAKVCSQQLIF